MISAQNLAWAQQMVNTLCDRTEFDFYVVREVYNSNTAALELYASALPINFTSDHTFTVDSGVCYVMDPTPERQGASYSYTGDSVSFSPFAGTVNVNSYEFVYSNSGIDDLGIVLVPDLREIGGISDAKQDTLGGSLVFLFAAFFLTAIGFKIFRA